MFSIKKITSIITDPIRKGKVMGRGQVQGSSCKFFQNSNFCLNTQPLSLVINPWSNTSFIFENMSAKYSSVNNYSLSASCSSKEKMVHDKVASSAYSLHNHTCFSQQPTYSACIRMLYIYLPFPQTIKKICTKRLRFNKTNVYCFIKECF